MAEIWGAAIGAAAIIGSGVMQSNAAKKAGKQQAAAAQAAIQQTEQNYQRTAANLNPYIDAGSSALAQMQKLNSGDYSSFTASPDYQFSLNQGLQGLDRSAAARGSLYSGGHSADVLNFAQGLASQNYNNYYSKLAGLAQGGQNAASNLGSVGTGNAAAIGGYLTNSGNAQAEGYINSANATSNMMGQLAGAYGMWKGNQAPPPVTASSYGNGSVLQGGTYTGNGSLATSWPGMNSTWG
jgi:hypothetical protein